MADPKSAFWPTKFLYVASLDLDRKNPRLDGKATNFSPKEIVQYLFQHDNAIEVANSIATRGYFPNEPLLAIREGTRYTIIEGNRRLASLMALREPGQLSGAAHRAVDRLSRSVSADSLKRVPVTIAPDRKSTDSQIAGRHVGTAVKAWRADNRARFILDKLDEGYNNTELQHELGFSKADVQKARQTRAITRLARSAALPPDIKQKIDDPRNKVLSSLERLFDSTVGRAIMHVERDEEHGYRVLTTQGEFRPFFEKLVTRMAKGEITTRTLNDNTKIQEHFKLKWTPGDLPVKKRGSFVPSELNQTAPSRPVTTKPQVNRQQPLFTTVLPKSLKVRFGSPRLRIIRDELTSLDRVKKANAGAVLLRVFFELVVVDYFIQSGKMPAIEAKLTALNIKWKHDYPEMRHLLKEIAELAERNLSRSESNKIKKALFGNREEAHALNDLHAFVHDFADLPTGQDIMQFWLRTESLFRLILETDPATHQ